MTNTRITALALGVLIAASGINAQDGDQHLLRYTLEKGDVLHYVFTQNSEMKMAAGDQPMTVDMNMQMFMEFRVLSTTDDKAQIQNKIYRLKMKTKNPMMGEVEFDTDDEDSVPAMFDAVLDMIGQKMKASVDSRGRISEIAIPEEMKETMVGRSGVDMEQVFSDFLVEFPEQPLAVGATWKSKRAKSLGQMGDATIDIVNTLVSVENDQATIQQQMTIQVADDAPVKPTMKAEGKLFLNAKTGMPINALESTQMTVTIPRGGMEMTMEMTGETTMKQTEPPAPKTKEGDAGKTDK